MTDWYKTFKSMVNETRLISGDMRHMSDSVRCVMGNVPVADRLQTLAQDLTRCIAIMEKTVDDKIQSDSNETRKAELEVIKAINDDAAMQYVND